MRILYVLNSTDPSGGATKSFLNLLNFMRRQGAEIAVAVPETYGIYPMLKEMGIEVFVCRYWPNVWPRTFRNYVGKPIRLTQNLIAAVKLTRFARRWKPDLIHTNTSVNDVGYLAAKALGIPHIWHIREYGDKDFNLKIIRLNHRVKAQNNYSISITRGIAEHRHVAERDTNRVIYNGIINTTPEVDLNAEREDYFFYAGRVDPYKGWEEMVRAFIRFRKRMPQAKTRLKIAGAHYNVEALEQQIKDELRAAGLDKDVDWLGIRNDVQEIMRTARATIIPSPFEAFGRVMPEAMSVGCLAIGRDTAGTREQMDNGLKLMGGEIALRFSTFDELTDRLVEVFSHDAHHYDDIRLRAAETIGQLYTNEAYGSQVLKFYQDIINGNR